MFCTCSRNFSISARISSDNRGDGQRFVFDARRFREHGVGFAMHFLQAGNRASCRARRRRRAALQIAARWLRRRSSSSLMSLRSASSAASCARRAGSMPVPLSNSFSRDCRRRAKAGVSADGKLAHFFGLFADVREPRAQLFGQMAAFGMAHFVELGQRFAQAIVQRRARAGLALRRLRGSGGARVHRSRRAGAAARRHRARRHLHLLAKIFGGTRVRLQQFAIDLNRRCGARAARSR